MKKLQIIPMFINENTTNNYGVSKDTSVTSRLNGGTSNGK